MISQVGDDGIGTRRDEARARGGVGDGDAAQARSLRGQHAARGVLDRGGLDPRVGAAELLQLGEPEQEGPRIRLGGGGAISADDHLDEVADPHLRERELDLAPEGARHDRDRAPSRALWPRARRRLGRCGRSARTSP